MLSSVYDAGDVGNRNAGLSNISSYKANALFRLFLQLKGKLAMTHR